MPETLELLEGGGGGTELLELLLGAELEIGATDELLLAAMLDEETAELLLRASDEELATLGLETPGQLLLS
jgi:hypothetical protein